MKKQNLIIAALTIILFLMGCSSIDENIPTFTQTTNPQISTAKRVTDTQIPTAILPPTLRHTPEPTNTKAPIPTKTPTPTLEPPQIDPTLKTWLQENAIPINTTNSGNRANRKSKIGLIKGAKMVLV